jgi:hypothetical protein
MKMYSKYAVILAMTAAVLYMYVPLELGKSLSLLRLDEIATIVKRVLTPAGPGPLAIDQARVERVEEDLDFRIAERAATIEGWSVFLAAHGTGVRAQSAREEQERLSQGDKSHTQPSTQVAVDPRADAQVTSNLGNIGPVRAEAATLASGASPASPSREPTGEASASIASIEGAENAAIRTAAPTSFESETAEPVQSKPASAPLVALPPPTQALGPNRMRPLPAARTKAEPHPIAASRSGRSNHATSCSFRGGSCLWRGQERLSAASAGGRPFRLVSLHLPIHRAGLRLATIIEGSVRALRTDSKRPIISPNGQQYRQRSLAALSLSLEVATSRPSAPPRTIGAK